MDRKIATLAERQHSLFTLVQARELGASRHAVGHRLAIGRWEELHDGVYRLAGSERTWEQRLHGLVLASGPVAAASHRSAAALLGIPGFERRGLIEVVTPRPRRHRDPEGLVHRWRILPDHHLTVVEGIPTTRVPRTLCDLAGVLHPGRTERALDSCLSLGIATPGTMQATFSDLAGRGRKGTAVMRRLLADRTEGYVPPASELEARFRDLVRDAGLSEPVRQLDVGDGEDWIGRVDAAYPARKLVLELDSGRHHTAVLDRDADGRRDAAMGTAGWRVERITWRELTDRPDLVVSRLRQLLTEPPAHELVTPGPPLTG
jgi:very-short-patch-repair endonuclease